MLIKHCQFSSFLHQSSPINTRDWNNIECYKMLITDDPTNQSFASYTIFSSVGCETSRVDADGPEFWLVSSLVFFKSTSVPKLFFHFLDFCNSLIAIAALAAQNKKTNDRKIETIVRTFPVMNFVNFNQKKNWIFL